MSRKKENITGQVTGYRCKCPYCRIFFCICYSCYRGQRYCSQSCSKQARASNRRRASRFYQATSKGKLNHQIRQKIYRKKQHLKKSVTHHSSEIVKKSLKKVLADESHQQLFQERIINHRKAKSFRCVCCSGLLTFFIDSS